MGAPFIELELTLIIGKNWRSSIWSGSTRFKDERMNDEVEKPNEARGENVRISIRQAVGWLVGCVLWCISPCGLFNAKSAFST